ncbi:Cobyrinic acid a,c-diamide synthetase [hydrothermal vent metagenome]|uniref:Cobyrinic acid a,c-diamide synthetase n=1 Tax=hydrothermal vent metagenome TaxID=652676 RepID=A0A3B1CPI8_9ZZZZ
MTVCARILVAGTHSGVGKTSIALGLVYALTRKGIKTRTYKVGPDFLDPTYLKRASGMECYNLDGWMMGEEYVKSLFERTSKGADIAIIEGVMGLFDGADPDGLEGSAAQIAKWLNAPVLLVGDAGGASRSFAATIKGFDSFEKEIGVAGVIANRCGSDSHAQILAQSLKSANAPELVGHIIKGSFPELPGRHLGLVTADENALTTQTMERLADTIEKSVDLDKIIRLASCARPFSGAISSAKAGDGSVFPVNIGVAYDKAFHFYYPDNLEAMEEHGARIVKFSPVGDERIPDDVDAIYIGGGYPEELAEELSSNTRMLESVRRFSLSGRPVYGECGGLIYLSQGVEVLDGRRFGFAGVLPAWTKMERRFCALGYVEATLKEETILGARNEMVRGHKFHYSDLVENPVDNGDWRSIYTLKRKRTGETAEEGYQRGNTLASYAHLHLASRPDAIKSFVSCCMNSRKKLNRPMAGGVRT